MVHRDSDHQVVAFDFSEDAVKAAEQTGVSGATADQDPGADLRALEEAGIDMGDVTQLLREAVDKFVEPFEKLIAGVGSSKEAAVTGRPATIESSIPDDLEPALARRVESAVSEGVARRVWRKDETHRLRRRLSRPAGHRAVAGAA